MPYGPSILDRVGQARSPDASDEDLARAQILAARWAEDLATVQQAKQEGCQVFDVFFSHAGEQKLDVVATLRQMLPRHILAFADVWALTHGQGSHTTMISACGRARVGVLVLSKEYVAKEWPMRELHILVEGHRRGEVGLVPLLWFDAFEHFDAIVGHYRQCNDHRRLWADDLEYLYQTTMVVKGVLTPQRAQPEVFQEVVDAAVRLLSQVPPGATSVSAAAGAGQRPVGFDEQLARLLEWMRAGGVDQQVAKAVWLHGPGGAGKTKMATQLRRDLEAAGLVQRAAVLTLEFTAGSGPTLSDKQAVDILRGAVLDLTGRDCTGASPGDVRRWFGEAAVQPGTLLLVDNVHSQEQIGLLLGEPLRLDSVPFMLFTSRLRQPVGGSALAGVWTQVHYRLQQHAVQPLPSDAALQLFRNNCRRLACVPEDLEERVVKSCGGLPLAVLIIAGVLAGQSDASAWLAAAQAMVAGGDPAADALAESEFGLERVMQHSLLGLGPEAVSMFLDAACVLVGRAERDALAVWRVWHGSSRAASALRQLKNRNVLLVDEQGALWMHDVLRWYGRRVVRGEAELGGQGQQSGSRLWVRDGCVEPQGVIGGSSTVVTAQLDHSMPALPTARGSSAMPALSRRDSMRVTSGAQIMLAGRQRVALPQQTLLWLEISGRECPELSTVIASSTQLCILRAHNVHDLCALPESLGQLPHLAVLDLAWCSKLTMLPESVGELWSLQLLDLTGCSLLTTLPESVGELAKLQRLNLQHCSGLTELPESVGQTSSLQELNLSHCSGLTALPQSLGQLTALRLLNLVGCSELIELPESLGQLVSLQELHLGSCSRLAELPESLGQLSLLQKVDLSYCSALAMLPESLGQLSLLQHLVLDDCSSLTVLPGTLGQLSSLQKLVLQNCSGLTELPESVGQLSALLQLALGSCRGLSRLPKAVGQLSALRNLGLDRCSELNMLPDSVGQLSSLQELNLYGCTGLCRLPESIGQLSSLSMLYLGSCTGLTGLPGTIGQLRSLQKLNLRSCNGLTALPEQLGQLPSLQALDCSGCSGLTGLPDSVGQLSTLQVLDLNGCSGLLGLPETVGQLSALQLLDLEGSYEVLQLPDCICQLSSLQVLCLTDCSELAELPASLGRLSSLQRLDLEGCSGLTALPESVGQLSLLRKLVLRHCSGLTRLPESVGQLPSLQELDLTGCSALIGLPESVRQLSSQQKTVLRGFAAAVA